MIGHDRLLAGPYRLIVRCRQIVLVTLHCVSAAVNVTCGFASIE
jgi:hypothetical protein